MRIANLHILPAEIKNQKPILPKGMVQGGAEVGSYKYAEALAYYKHTVTHLTGKYPGITVKELKINKKFSVKYFNLHFREKIVKTFSFELFKELLFGNYGVIHSHQIPTIYSLLGGVAARLSNKKFIVTFSGRLPTSKIEIIIAKIVSLLSNHITVQNYFGYNLIENFTDKTKILIVPHGIDTNHFYKRKLSKDFINKYNPNGEKVILFAGRLIPAKGIDVLIESLHLLNKENDTKLIIIGEGPEKKSLLQLIKRYSLQDKIYFTGLVKQEDLPFYYSLADVFVLPSTEYDMTGKKIPKVSENFGLVLAESMACQTPIVASKFGGIADWIMHGKNGLLFQERNVKELTLMIKSIITNTFLREKIVKNAFEDINSKYSLKAVVKEFEKIYR